MYFGDWMMKYPTYSSKINKNPMDIQLKNPEFETPFSAFLGW